MSHGALALVVDDDDAIRFMVGKILEREGFQVEEARDGFEAIEKFRQDKFTIMLLDLMMPRFDGFHVLRKLKELNPAFLNRVVVMTALSPESIGFPIQRVLFKPFDVRHLAEQAREMRDRCENIA